jgi:PBS lyase HEAT-like repeat-containing protein
MITRFLCSILKPRVLRVASEMRIARTTGKEMNIRILLAILASTFAISVFGHQEQQRSPATELAQQFTSEKVFWKQLEIARKIVASHDTSVLSDLAAWLKHDDRHVRGNVAFVFAGLGDERGFAVIAAILEDRSDRPEGQGQPFASSDGRYHVAAQIRADRYYAIHLFGLLKDRRAVPILIPLLSDREVNYKVPWALGEIGDLRADRALIAALGDADPSIRVFAIQALEKLGAREALPSLRGLLNDYEKSRLGTPVTVAETARAAILKLESKP